MLGWACREGSSNGLMLGLSLFLDLAEEVGFPEAVKSRERLAHMSRVVVPSIKVAWKAAQW